MRSDHELLEDVFSADPAFESGLLQGTLQYARRRKRRGLIKKAALVAIVCCAGVVALLPKAEQRQVARAPSPPPSDPRTEARVVPGTSIRVLTDEELLALFAGRPVALIGSGDERQFVVLDAFRRPREQTVN